MDTAVALAEKGSRQGGLGVYVRDAAQLDELESAAQQVRRNPAPPPFAVVFLPSPTTS